LAHLQAIKVEEAKNKRFILHNKSLWLREVAEILKEEFGATYKINSGDLRYCTLRIASIFYASAKLILPYWDKPMNLDNAQSREVLGI
jgi:hypothetical protein